MKNSGEKMPSDFGAQRVKIFFFSIVMIRGGGNLRFAVLIGFFVFSLLLAVYYFHAHKQGILISADGVMDGLENIITKDNGEFFTC